MLEELFPKRITSKIIEYVIMHDGREFNYKDLKTALKVSQPSVYTALKTLLKFGLIIETRRIGKSILYQTNTVSSLYSILKKLIMEASIHKHVIEINGDQ